MHKLRGIIENLNATKKHYGSTNIKITHVYIWNKSNPYLQALMKIKPFLQITLRVSFNKMFFASPCIPDNLNYTILFKVTNYLTICHKITAHVIDKTWTRNSLIENINCCIWNAAGSQLTSSYDPNCTIYTVDLYSVDYNQNLYYS